jgi:hypothetical protein
LEIDGQGGQLLVLRRQQMAKIAPTGGGELDQVQSRGIAIENNPLKAGGAGTARCIAQIIRQSAGHHRELQLRHPLIILQPPLALPHRGRILFSCAFSMIWANPLR